MTEWRKSSFSGPEVNCVEVELTDLLVGLRDTKNPDAGSLIVTPAAFRSLVGLTTSQPTERVSH